MDLIPNLTESPRLLSTAAIEVRPSSDTTDDSKYRLKHEGFFMGNGRAIFIGILAGALLLAAGGFLFSRYRRATEEMFVFTRKFFHVRTQSIVPPNDSATRDSGVRVQIRPDLLRVTAISLGHPRLAIVNGREVTEGDSVTVRSPAGGVTVTLTVVNIADGRIELTDGSQIVTSRLEAAPARPAHR